VRLRWPARRQGEDRFWTDTRHQPPYPRIADGASIAFIEAFIRWQQADLWARAAPPHAAQKPEAGGDAAPFACFCAQLPPRQ
jgi:hypothetical protein